MAPKTKFIEVAGFLFLSALATRLLFFFNQSFAGQISGAHLHVASLLNFLILFHQLVGEVVAQAAFVLISKKSSSGQQTKLVGGALIGYALVAVIGFAVSSLCLKSYLTGHGLIEFPGALACAWLTLFTAVLVGANQIFRLAYFATGLRARALVPDLGLLGVSVLTKLVILGSAIEPLTKFISFSVVDLVCQGALAFCYWSGGRSLFDAGAFGDWRAFARTARSLMVGESVFKGALILEPVLYSLLLASRFDAGSASAVLVGFSVLSFFGAPMTATLLAGITRLGSIWTIKDQPVWDEYKKTIGVFAVLVMVLPAIVLAVTVSHWLEPCFGLSGASANLTVAFFVLSAVPVGFSIASACQLRVFEQSRKTGAASLLSVYGVGFPLALILIAKGAGVEAIGLAIFISRIFGGGLTAVLGFRTSKLRRASQRLVVRADWELSATVIVDSRMKTADQVRVFDISAGGCALIFDGRGDHELKKGDDVVVQFVSMDLALEAVTGRVQRVPTGMSVLEKMFFRRRIVAIKWTGRAEDLTDKILVALATRRRSA